MPTSNPDHTTVIGPGAHIKGEMTFEHGVTILGGFEGRIVSAGEVEIATSAACKASITATTVRIDGDVQGDISARQAVHLGPKASMTGDIAAARLLVTDGASFLGHCKIGPDAVAGIAVPRAVPPPARPARPRAPQVRPRGADIETRSVEVAKVRLAEAQAKLLRMSSQRGTTTGSSAA